MFLRALPAEFRERVAEPALYDLFAARGEGNRSTAGRYVALLAWALECLRLGTPPLLWRRGLTRLGATLLLGGLIVFFVVQRISYARLH
jgi:hypothetical protein